MSPVVKTEVLKELMWLESIAPGAMLLATTAAVASLVLSTLSTASLLFVMASSAIFAVKIDKSAILFMLTSPEIISVLMTPTRLDVDINASSSTVSKFECLNASFLLLLSQLITVSPFEKETVSTYMLDNKLQ